MKKKFICTFIIFLIVSVFGLGVCQASSGIDIEEKTLKLGFITADGSVRDIAAQQFKKVVEEKTDGKIKIEIYSSGVLGTMQEMIESVRVGALDMQLAGGGTMVIYIPQFAAAGAPFLFNSYEEAYALLDGPVGDSWAEAAEEKGFKLLSYCDLGMAQITNNVRPINSPKDLKGLKMRSPNEATYIKTFQDLGSAVSTLAYSELYLALSQGVVDGQFNPIDAIMNSSFDEVQNYLAMSNIFYYYVSFIMNKDLWDSFDEDVQQIIQEAAYEARDASREYIGNYEAELLEEAKKSFKEITYPDSAPFREMINPDNMLQIVGGDTMKQVDEFLKEYRSKK